jgi:hypothetical protein
LYYYFAVPRVRWINSREVHDDISYVNAERVVACDHTLTFALFDTLSRDWLGIEDRVVSIAWIITQVYNSISDHSLKHTGFIAKPHAKGNDNRAHLVAVRNTYETHIQFSLP